jgi:mono/diheme cytochrome c family protein/glucose/arabinose dehydrogenase
MRFRFSCLIALGILFATASHAQQGDRKGHDMVENWKNMDVPPAPPLTPEEALKTIKTAPGFKVELVVSEPEIVNPVAMTWDGDGRLWVVQMVDYMPNVDGKNEDAGNGRISVHEDTNGDGKLDKHTVFLDKLVMPRAVAVVPGGVLVAEPPNLWYCQDSDGDFKCDKKESLLGNFAKQGPVEHTDNGLMFALDNWIYNAKSSRRFQFADGKLTEDVTKFRGQWGITQDNYGRLYYTSNSRWLMSDWDTHNAPIKMGFHDGSINSIRINVGINRGYMGNMLRPDGRLAKVTAISGPGIYRGDVYGDDYVNGAFITEPAANAIGFFKYSDDKNNPVFQHQLYPDEKFGKREFITSTDERFRPVSLATGPDGCMYFIDLNHGILQHRVYVTTYLRKQILERGLDKHNMTGRIYRIVPDGKSPKAKPKLEKAETATLVKALAHPNGWWRDTAQRLIVQRQLKDAAPALRNMIKSHDSHLARLHALWTLRGIGELTADDAAVAAKDSHVKLKHASGMIMVGSLSAKKEKYATNVKKLDKNGQKAYKEGAKVYGTTCFGCHQPNGKGLKQVAPPLVKSDWVNGDLDRLIRVTLHGVSGDIKVSGKDYKGYPPMPGHGPALDDNKIAQVLTYVRNTWGNASGAVDAKQVSKVRNEHKGRVLPWTTAELK